MGKSLDFENVTGPRLTKEHWKWTVLSCIADYLDAGTIVAGGSALLIWMKYFDMNLSLAGIIGAFSANGIAAAVGAVIAGYFGDKFGRKSIYTFDLLVYMFGALLIVFAVSPVLFISGYVIMGLATGADVPTSWSLIAEFSPKRSRGKLMGLTNVFWYVGPIVILALSLALSPLGLLGIRLVFASLFIVALITYFFRRSMIESPRWSAVHGKRKDLQKDEIAVSETSGSSSDRVNPRRSQRMYKEFFTKKNFKSLLLIAVILVFWNIPAGTYGFFFPYIFETVGANSKATTDFMQMIYFALAIVSVLFIFLPLGDRVNRKILYTTSAACCGCSFLILIFFPISNVYVAIANIVLFGFGQGIGLWPLNRVWSVELFPTEIRNTFVGFSRFASRFVVGIWSFLVPATTLGGLHGVAIVMTLCFAICFMVGLLFAPKTQGKSLEEIQI